VLTTRVAVFMRPYAVIRAAAILAFLVWVGWSAVPLLQPAKHVRETDAAPLPSSKTNPHPTVGAAQPQPPALTEAQVSGCCDSAATAA
jgi:hypothetical protein